MDPQTAQIIADILTGILSIASVGAAIKVGLDIHQAIKDNQDEKQAAGSEQEN